jgi:hypothetical protein
MLFHLWIHHLRIALLDPQTWNGGDGGRMRIGIHLSSSMCYKSGIIMIWDGQGRRRFFPYDRRGFPNTPAANGGPAYVGVTSSGDI